MEDKVVQLDLTVGEVNGILQALGQLPFVQVSGLIAKVKNQAEVSLSKQPAPSDTDE